MRKRTVGPLQLLDGLQLMPAEGKPTGLYRALNVEPRDGYLQTRRGQTLRATIERGGNSIASPAVAAGSSAIWWRIDVAPTPDTMLYLTIGPGTLGVGDMIENGVTLEFWGEDDAWHVIDGYIVSGGGDIRIDATRSIVVNVVSPYGWKSAQPAGAGSVGYWMRATLNGGAVLVDGTLPRWNSGSVQSDAEDAAVLCPRTRTGTGPYVIARVVTPAASFAGWPDFLWNIYDLSMPTVLGGIDEYSYINGTAGYEGAGLLNDLMTAAFAAGTVNDFAAGESDTVCALYIPALDHIIASLGGHYFEITCADGTAAVFTPDPQDDADVDPYADIGVETALPKQPRAMVLFGGRIFLLGAMGDPQRVQWGAPSPYNNVFPSANLAHIDGAGIIQGGAAIDQSLFIMTERGIWRAALGDPTDGNESNLFISQVEATPCVARRSIVTIGKSIVFLSTDGVRAFDGVRSRLLTSDVRDLFRKDSEHPLACLRPEKASAAWHPLENQYRLSYPSPAGESNDTMLVVDLDDKTCWLWGADPVSAAESGVENPSQGYIGQRQIGVRALAMEWDQEAGAMLALCPDGIVAYQDSGDTDFSNQPVQWYAESQTLGIANAQRSVMETVVVEVAREHFQSMRVKAIPDGDYARADHRDVAVQPDQLDTTSAIGSASLAGSIAPLQLDGSIAPLRARFRKSGRNHRIRLESVSPHAPFKVLSVSADIATDEAKR